MNLQDFFRDHPRTAVAFSGGVDSAYLLYAASRFGAEVRAYYVRSPFQPRFEYEDAVRLARLLEVPLVTLDVDILSDSTIAANPKNRCYYCKRQIFTAIIRAAEADDFPVLLDGTSASDAESDRPGMQALRELEVLSPLRLCGLTKPEIRRLSREAGLFTHDKPAYACLATRIPTGTPITTEDLLRTEEGESSLREMGFSDFRIRLLNDCARIQLPESQLPKALALREEILGKLKQYYSGVVLDLEVRDEQ